MADAYSDFDLAIFCSDYDPFTKDEKWLSQIGSVWVCVHEKVHQGGNTFPTRLVIFEGGVKVDFGFYTMGVLQDLVHAKPLPDEYNRGYSVLVDKESLTASMLKATHKEGPGRKPTEQVFQRVVSEFWFEAYHVAIYLKREDLWSVKFRSTAMHAFLLPLTEWEAQARNQWNQTTPPIGKRMASWVDAGTWKALQGVFAHFEARDSWNALFHTLALFRRLSVDLSRMLEFDYPEDLDKNMSRFILELRAGNTC
jgi:aminoglycoside 6-adenylyltransferase